jgi:hypothetical protein
MTQYPQNPHSTQGELPATRHYAQLPPELVAKVLALLADGRPRRSFRVFDALGLPEREHWRVFPTLCALADDGRILRDQNQDGTDVFSMTRPDRPIPDLLADCRFIRLVSHGGIPQPPPTPVEGPNWITGNRDDAERWLAAAGNVGLLLKDLVCIDIDPKHELPRTATLDRDMAISVADDIARRLFLPLTLTQRTRSGGLHFLYRAEPRRVYAEVPRPELMGQSGPLVECRSGPHRWIILSPSRFTWPQASMRWLRRHPLAAAPDWLPWKEWRHTPPPPPPGGIRPQTTDALSAHLDFRALLTSDGWELAPHRDGYTLAVRPGKHAQDGASATLDRVAPGVLHVFSTSAPLPPGNYNAWAYLVAAHFDGNALAALAAYEVSHGLQR